MIEKEKEKGSVPAGPEQAQRSRPSQRGSPVHWCTRAPDLNLTGGAQALVRERGAMKRRG